MYYYFVTKFIIMNFNNKVVLVTGGSSGIGAAIAIKFSAAGAKVAIVGRNETKLKAVVEKCNNPLVIIADMTKENDVKRIALETIAHFGRLDILVNNAGVASTESIKDANALESYNAVMATNVHSVVQLTHYLVPHIIATKGNIINISSVAAMMVSALVGFAYTTSKAALDHFTRSIASELASSGVRVNSVNPGPVKTDIDAKLGIAKEESDAFWENAGKSTPLKRVSDSEEIADLVLFLASDSARGITGSTFVSDNGLLVGAK
ncbi:uncharacterized protein LOC113493533 [Trichoplusia ni]|uniref:Uncharacterized protein LOC113493533 n=1 Tax=Trichoplusia ni TaxID=7111 RepID=A0A7E5VGC0_TRINI|nr:uncharacterized protein LOC113493533 [Trichoplusia ni]